MLKSKRSVVQLILIVLYLIVFALFNYLFFSRNISLSNKSMYQYYNFLIAYILLFVFLNVCNKNDKYFEVNKKIYIVLWLVLSLLAFLGLCFDLFAWYINMIITNLFILFVALVIYFELDTIRENAQSLKKLGSKAFRMYADCKDRQARKDIEELYVMLKNAKIKSRNKKYIDDIDLELNKISHYVNTNDYNNISLSKVIISDYLALATKDN